MKPIVTFHRHDRVLIVACHGELDLAARDDLWAALITPLIPAPRDTPPGSIRLDAELVELDGRLGDDVLDAGTPGVDLTGIETAVVDLADVPFLDCTAIGVLAALARLTRRTGIALRVTEAQPRVRRVFTLLGLDRTFALTCSLAEAIA